MVSTLQVICNVIILIGGVAGAIFTIGKFFGVPFNFLKKKKKAQIQKELNELLPALMDKYKEDFHKEFEEIKEINLQQNKEIQKQNKDTQNIIEGLRDDLRYKIMDIYQKYKLTKQIPIYEKEKLDETFKDYKQLHGNHYIEKYYNRMQKWTVVDSKEEEEI